MSRPLGDAAIQRGGASVGLVHDLAPVEAGAVLYLRLWCDGTERRDQMKAELEGQLGYGRGLRAYEAFDSLCGMWLRYGRRPMVRHQLACKCLGADESCFANFIGYASEGEREDAFLLASNMVRPDVAMILVTQAERFGLALRQMVIGTPVSQLREPVTLH